MLIAQNFHNIALLYIKITRILRGFQKWFWFGYKLNGIDFKICVYTWLGYTVGSPGGSWHCMGGGVKRGRGVRPEPYIQSRSAVNPGKGMKQVVVPLVPCIT